MIKSYDIRQVEQFLIGQKFNEVIGEKDESIRFFIKDRYVVKLKVTKRKIDRLQAELVCENIDYDFDKFNKWYKRAKKHRG